MQVPITVSMEEATHDDEISSSHSWHYRKGDFWGLCSCMTGVALCLWQGVNLNETTLDSTWRAVGLIGSKSLEIGADSTCENRRTRHLADRGGSSAGSLRRGPSASRAAASSHLPGSTLMATLPLVPSKKWRWFARDLLGFGYARSRQSLVIPGVPPSLGPLFWGLASFPLAVPVRIRLIPTASTCLALTLRPNKCINPQVHSAPKAV